MTGLAWQRPPHRPTQAAPATRGEPPWAVCAPWAPRVAWALCLGLLGGCAQFGRGGAPDAHGPLPAATQRALEAAGVSPDALAAIALPLGHRGRPWGHRAAVPMQPGSTMKLVTSAVALERLGPGHRGHTTLTSGARLADGVLHGDLRLEGGADPELGIPAFWALLVELRAAGVQRIAGDLVIDRHLFFPARADRGAPPFDEGPEWGYNVIPDALGLAGALLPVEIDSRSGAVVARTVPPLAGIEVRSRMALADRRCAAWDEGWQPPRAADEAGTLVVELRGDFPRECRRRLSLQVPDRLRLEASIFRTLWASLGGTLDGQVREAEAPDRAGKSAGPAAGEGAAPAHVLARREARPWGEVLRRMNKVSDNAQTRLLYLALGAAHPEAAPGQPTAALAERVVRQWLEIQGIAAPGLVLDNGSGLSRSERITPHTLARLLQVAWAGRYASDFVASLPLAGEDGTLRARLRDSPASGWARLKTGTLRNVAALAGYVRDAEGRPWAVAMMINHERARAARPALDALVDALARSVQPGDWADDWVEASPPGPEAAAAAQPAAAGGRLR